MGAKHTLKLGLRGFYARVLFHTGLHAVVNKLMPTRLTILGGHCVRPASGAWPAGAHLPPEMSITESKLDAFIAWFGARYDVVTVGAGVERLDGGARGRSMLALSFDDGYRDNARVLGPLLARRNATATVFLETRPLDERRVNWSHKYFWILARTSPSDLMERWEKHARDLDLFHTLNQIAAEGRLEPVYHLKRVLKYDADPAERDRVLDAVFADLGGDERALADELYMTWDEARELQQLGVELGGHTISHHILSKLTPEQQQREIAGGAEAMRRELGRAIPTFAYPWGRRWDFDAHSVAAAKASGFRCAVTMHAGTNRPKSERFALARVAIDDSAQLHLLVAEACGGFELLRKFGLDLSE
jgi:peptidoglycan/xylan/chitin deacetylase (PgdA/CDA1 family)